MKKYECSNCSDGGNFYDSILHNVPICLNCGSRAKTHGGARKGAGRKPKEPTKTIRVPISKLESVKILIGKK